MKRIEPKIDVHRDAFEAYITDHAKELGAKVNKKFEEYKADIREQLLCEIQDYLTDGAIHYEWTEESWDMPYDHSGSLIMSGEISLDQTVSEFLKDEYTGNKRASFMSGCGWFYDTYSEPFSELTREIGWHILCEVLKQEAIIFLGSDFNEESFDDWCCDCDFDPVYDESLSSDFFFSECAVDFAEIGDILLSDVMQMQFERDEDEAND